MGQRAGYNRHTFTAVCRLEPAHIVPAAACMNRAQPWAAGQQVTRGTPGLGICDAH
jgi:hypothetical protein